MLLRLFTRLYGLNAWLWYLSSCGIAIATTLLFYLFASRIGLNQIASLCFAFLICIGHQASTYARFGTPETTATLFVAIAFLASVSAKQNQGNWGISNAIFVLASLLAALNKEACILMLPAMAALKLWVDSLRNEIKLSEAWKRNLPETTILMASFIVLVGTVKILNVTGPGYAGFSMENLNPAALLSIIKIMVKKTSFVVGGLLLLPLAWNQIKRREWPNWGVTGLYITAILIVAPQMLLYSKSGIQDHYLLPMTIGISLAAIFPIKWLTGSRQIVWKSMAIGFILLFMVVGMKTTYSLFRQTSTTTREMKGMLDDLRKWAGQNKSIFVLGNPFVHYEKLFGLKTAVTKMINTSHLYLVTYGSERSAITIDSMRAEEKNWLYIDPATLATWYGDKGTTLRALDAEGLQEVVVAFSPNKIKTTLDELIINKKTK
jgi:4-amino-4-deoxy-L-arabinose transferase-like glycosyltransferase